MRKNSGNNLTDIPPYEDFLRELDERLYAAFDMDASGRYWAMFCFFDSKEKPLSPRELLEFDAALTQEERLLILLELC
jgi:hypothetical protein